MICLTARKVDQRFQPVVVKAGMPPAGHPSKFCRTGVIRDKRNARQGSKASQLKAATKD